MFIQKQSIDIINIKSGSNNREALVGKLRIAIRDEQECVLKETQQHMTETADFWHYANQTTYSPVEDHQTWNRKTEEKPDVTADEEIKEEFVTLASQGIHQ